MKKRFLAGLMTLCLLLSLLPTAALASGNYDEKEARVTSYEELVAALADPEMRYIYIQAYKSDIYGESTGEPFSWPEGDVTLNMDWDPSQIRGVYVTNGIWTIPENVTVNLYDSLNVAGNPNDPSKDGGILIEGIWNYMTRYATISCPTEGCASVTVAESGVMGIEEDVWVTPANVEDFIVNGTIINRGDLRIDDLTMGDGAKIEGITPPNHSYSNCRVFLGGTITCEGTATIEGWLDVGDSTTNTITAGLKGNFVLDRLMIDNEDSLVIPSGSRVSVKDLWAIADDNDEHPVLYLDGTLVLENAGFSHSLDGNVEMRMGENSVLEIWHLYGGLEDNRATGKITGTGTVKLFAAQRVLDNGKIRWYDRADVFNCDGSEGDWPPQVEDTVTIWRCWEDEGWCEHSWGDPVTLEPTCGAQGYTYAVCEDCGIERQSDFKMPLEQHTGLTAEPNSDTYLRLSCSGCGHSGMVWLEAGDVEYVEGQSAEGAYLSGANDWLPEQPTITYTNNDKPGTATATVTIMGITLTTTFEIVECLHEGGEATCSQKAVCGKCGQPYGETTPHVEKTPATCKEQAVCAVCGQRYGEVSDEHHWGDEFSASATQHWVSCEDCGKRMTSQEEMAKWMDERGLLRQWHIYLETYYGDLPLVEAYGYFGHIFPSGSDTCVFCSGGPLRTESEEGKTQVDLILDALDVGKEIQIVAAVYAGGQMVGAAVKSVTVSEGGTAEESLEVQYGKQYSPDNCKVFVLDSEGSLPLLNALQSSMG